jgi:hypothetical protein
MPTFDDGFSDLLKLVDSILSADPALRFVLVLDEFDEIPSVLYQDNDEAAAFFNTLRSLTRRGRTGLILIGGENLPFVLEVNGAALNRVESYPVGAFRRQDEYEAFKELVTMPTAGCLEFSTKAISALYDVSAGHPYFAKVVCQSIFALMLERKDASVTTAEVAEAVGHALNKTGATAFAHFWSDAIWETDPAFKQQVAQERRVTLLAVARAMRSAQGATRDQVDLEAKRLSLGDLELQRALSSFMQRGILEIEGDRIVAVIPFFGRWLRDHGNTKIVTDSTDEVARIQWQAHLDDAAITEEEIAALVSGWALYRSREIQPKAVREWLEQFGGLVDQRRALNVLSQLEFIHNDAIQAVFLKAHQKVTHGWKRQLGTGQHRFTDVVIVPLDAPETSGQAYGLIYADVNHIHRSNVVVPDVLEARLRSTRREAGAVVFVDDFISTGRNIIKVLGDLGDDVLGRIRRRGIRCVMAVIAGFDEGIAAVEEWLAEEQLPISIVVDRRLGDRDHVFAPESRYFSNPTERVATSHLFESVAGGMVANSRPLEWSETQALVVLESSVPNGTLPHLWTERGGDNPWKPLFERF